MSSKMNLRLVLTGKDEGASKLLKDQQSQIKKLNDEAARTTDQSTNKQMSAVRRLAQEHRQKKEAMSRLGLRTERDIQREIRQTEVAYRKLASSGVAAQKDLARASQQSKRQVSELRHELGQTSKIGRMARGLGTMASAGYGMYQTAQSVAMPKIERVIDYDLMIRENASLMDEKGTPENRERVKKVVTQQVDDAVAIGGNRDGVVKMQNALAAAGQLNEEQIGAAMKAGSRVHVASYMQADYGDLANASQALINFGFTDKTLEDGLAKMFIGGKVGGFEIKDMASTFKEQLAAASGSGFKSTKNLDWIIALNENAADISGGPSEAANNVKQFLESVNNKTTKNLLAKAYNTSPAEIDNHFIEGMNKGKNPAEVFDGLVQNILTRSPEWNKLQQRIENTKSPDERKALVEQQARFLEGSVVGEILPDQQRRYGYLALTNNRDVFADRLEKIQAADKNSPAYLQDYNDASASNAFKVQQAKNKQEQANESIYSPIADKFGDAASWFSKLDTGTAATMTGLKDALSILAGGAITGTIGSFILKGMTGGGAGGGLTGWLGGGAASATTTTGIGTTAASVAAPLAIASAPLALMGGATYLAGQTEKDVERAGMFKRFSEWLQGMMPDPTAASRAEWEKKRADLNGDTPQSKSEQTHPLLQTLADSLKQTQQSLAAQQIANGNGAFSAMTNQTLLDAATYQQGVREGSDIVSEKLNAINSTLSGQQQTIQNNISVNLDGRIVAEQVATYQIQTYNRGAGQ